jgi:hypothetical protein
MLEQCLQERIKQHNLIQVLDKRNSDFHTEENSDFKIKNLFLVQKFEKLFSGELHSKESHKAKYYISETNWINAKK